MVDLNEEPHPAIWRVIMNSAGAAAAIIAVKWHLEGISPPLLQLLP